MKFLQETKKEIGEEKTLDVGEIYKEVNTTGKLINYLDIEYFVLGYDRDLNIYCCKKGSRTLVIVMMSSEEVFKRIEEGKLYPVEDTDHIIVDEDLLSEKELEEFKLLKAAMNEIVASYSPDFSYIVSKTNKNHLKELAKSCNMDYNLFRRKITKYLSSGMKDYSLLSKRSKVFGDRRKRNKPYEYKELTGKKAKNSKGDIIPQGVILTDEIKKSFEPFVEMVRKGLTIPQAYIRYCASLQVLENAFQDGNKLLTNKDQRPTLAQFRYYVEGKLGRKDKIIGTKGSLYYHNNYRSLNSDNLTNTGFPGDIVEIDAWEADVALVDRINNEPVGRATVYLMIDRYTRLICACSVGYEVNSFIGLSNLFMSLAEDKVEKFERNGLHLDGWKIPLPDPFLPNLIVTDNGSDFKSNMFRDTLSRLEIEHEIAPPGVGSAKGLVERTFGEFAIAHKDVFKKSGLITKDYGSTHHKDAVLTLDEYEKYLLLAVVEHNFKAMGAYPVHDKELLEKDIPLNPYNLWRYYTEEKQLRPREIIDKSTYYYSLMNKVKASLNIKGVVFKGLYYSVQGEPKFVKMQERNKTKHLDLRLDPRDVSKLYYLDSGELKFLPLNPSKASNRIYFGKTLKEAEKLKALEKDLKRKGADSNEDLLAAGVMVADAMVKDAKKNKPKKDKKVTIEKIRENRKAEKLERAYEGRISNQIELEEDSIPALPKAEEKTSSDIGKYSSYEEWLEDFESAM